MYSIQAFAYATDHMLSQRKGITHILLWQMPLFFHTYFDVEKLNQYWVKNTVVNYSHSIITPGQGNRLIRSPLTSLRVFKVCFLYVL